LNKAAIYAGIGIFQMGLAVCIFGYATLPVGKLSPNHPVYTVYAVVIAGFLVAAVGAILFGYGSLRGSKEEEESGLPVAAS
jgi:hypothetical protein